VKLRVVTLLPANSVLNPRRRFPELSRADKPLPKGFGWLCKALSVGRHVGHSQLGAPGGPKCASKDRLLSLRSAACQRVQMLFEIQTLNRRILFELLQLKL
jgi:hypothetical protein